MNPVDATEPKEGTAMPSTATQTSVKELAHRATDGLEVALYWHERSNTVSVVVHDAKTSEAFELVLHESDNALDAFHHPYAYAAHRGLEVGAPAHDDGVAVAA